MPDINPPPPINPLEIHGQLMTLVLAALYDYGSTMTKQETIRYISDFGWFNLQREDWEPFRTQNEPKWHTMLAFGRKDCVERELLDSEAGRDNWRLTRKGKEAFERARKAIASEGSVYRGFFWSPKFKEWFSPGYKPSAVDVARPADYRSAFLSEYE